MPTITEFKLNPLDGSTTTEYSDGTVKSGSIVPASELTSDVVSSLVNVNITASAVAASSYVSIASIGDSISRSGYSPVASGGNIGSQRVWTGFGAWLALAAFKTKGKCIPDIYAVEGYSGLRTDEILASAQLSSATEAWGASGTIPIGISARPQQIVVVMAGTNDITFYEGGNDVNGIAKTVAGLRALWNFVRSTGAKPIALSLLPRSAPALYASRVPAYNAAIEAAADEMGVPFVDVYSVCAAADGGWKAGYTYHNGVHDVTGLHPSWEASLKIADVLGAALSAMLTAVPTLPRIVKGSPAIYSIPFRTGIGGAMSQFLDGTFPNTTGVAVRYDAQGDATVNLAATSIDSDGWTVEFSKPSNAAARYADFAMPTKTVAAGEKYVLFADVEMEFFDGFSSMAVYISDNTYQPIARFGVSAKDMIAPVQSGLLRISLPYTVPPSVTTVRPMFFITREAGGVAGGTDKLRIANMGHLRVA